MHTFAGRTVAIVLFLLIFLFSLARPHDHHSTSDATAESSNSERLQVTSSEDKRVPPETSYRLFKRSGNEEGKSPFDNYGRRTDASPYQTQGTQDQRQITYQDNISQVRAKPQSIPRGQSRVPVQERGEIPPSIANRIGSYNQRTSHESPRHTVGNSSPSSVLPRSFLQPADESHYSVSGLDRDARPASQETQHAQSGDQSVEFNNLLRDDPPSQEGSSDDFLQKWLKQNVAQMSQPRPNESHRLNQQQAPSKQESETEPEPDVVGYMRKKLKDEHADRLASESKLQPGSEDYLRHQAKESYSRYLREKGRNPDEPFFRDKLTKAMKTSEWRREQMAQWAASRHKVRYVPNKWSMATVPNEWHEEYRKWKSGQPPASEEALGKRYKALHEKKWDLEEEEDHDKFDRRAREQSSDPTVIADIIKAQRKTQPGTTRRSMEATFREKTPQDQDPRVVLQSQAPRGTSLGREREFFNKVTGRSAWNAVPEYKSPFQEYSRGRLGSPRKSGRAVRMYREREHQAERGHRSGTGLDGFGPAGGNNARRMGDDSANRSGHKQKTPPGSPSKISAHPKSYLDDGEGPIELRTGRNLPRLSTADRKRLLTADAIVYQRRYDREQAAEESAARARRKQNRKSQEQSPRAPLVEQAQQEPGPSLARSLSFRLPPLPSPARSADGESASKQQALQGSAFTKTGKLLPLSGDAGTPPSPLEQPTSSQRTPPPTPQEPAAKPSRVSGGGGGGGSSSSSSNNNNNSVLSIRERFRQILAQSPVRRSYGIRNRNRYRDRDQVGKRRGDLYTIDEEAQVGPFAATRPRLSRGNRGRS